ncbi:MAG: Leucyl-tRNA synthetase, mitochondrial [Claussenomyces sp. TS43310]|nr:MAG: Leucyl-tRNA synthetase, mitochondrial [Claussenomyces sp. TS43310]
MQRAVSHRIGRIWPRRGKAQRLRNTSIYSVSSQFARFDSFEARRNYADSSRLDLHALDQKWQRIWEERAKAPEICEDAGTGQKMYILPMFPYPSGNLHLGHFRNYTIPDVLARFRRMQGYNVLLPMGWDAFGLPAENAAIERGIDPAVWTKDNIAKMRVQLRAMNGSWDWSRELTTCDPDYYKHTQRIFLLLHERGLAYQAEHLVNYDPVDRTVLANEQVDANGCSWRSGAKVEKRLLKQWFLKISAFRDALLDDLELLSENERWPERVVAMQKNWLGRSRGAKIKFPLMAFKHDTQKSIEVFTTRPDTLFGVQYVALSENHSLIVELAKTDSELQAFLDTIPALPQDSKAGYLLPNVRAINPLAYESSTPEATKGSLPIYVAPYVMGDYAHGAVMGVPGHDNRDFAFWKQNGGDTPVRMVVKPSLTDATTEPKEAFVHHGVLSSHSGAYEGLTSKEATQEIVKLLSDADLAETSETWRLRDWLISRQRYWGTPIPIVHCDSCGPVPIPVEDLPVKLPSVEGHWLRGKAGNPLDDAHEWVNTPCPKCHSPAKRDTDTMDTFVDSSWYFMRFADPHNQTLPFSADAANQMLPVDIYIGGVEHAILHLLYARFITKFLASADLWPAGAAPEVRGEPFKQLLTQGMVHGKTYTDPATGRFLKPDEVDTTSSTRPVIIATGVVANISFEKMSKSKYNGVDPTSCIVRYGADATRAHMLFQAPPSEVLEWDEDKIAGVTRWLRRLHDHIERSRGCLVTRSEDGPKAYFNENMSAANSFDKARSAEWDKQVELWLSVQRTIISVTESLTKTYSLNTVVSDLMGLTNIILDLKEDSAYLQPHALSALIKMMAPITPAFSEECWQILHDGANTPSIFDLGFPKADGTLHLLKSRNQTCAVQVNGKLKLAVEIPKAPPGLTGQALAAWITEQILGTAEGKSRLAGALDVANAKKVIVVRGGKTVNFVI